MYQPATELGQFEVEAVNDRLKLRSLVVPRSGSAIRTVNQELKYWVIGSAIFFKKVGSGTRRVTQNSVGGGGVQELYKI
jgi:hypothetical protein